MQFSRNVCFLVGNVTRNPEILFTNTGIPVAKFGMATSRSVKKEEKWEQVTTFHNIVCFQKLAEYVTDNLKSGMYVTVEGRIENSQYEKDGVKHYKSEIIADEVFFKKIKKEEV